MRPHYESQLQATLLPGKQLKPRKLWHAYVSSIRLSEFPISKIGSPCGDRRTSPSWPRACDWPACLNDAGWDFSSSVPAFPATLTSGRYNNEFSTKLNGRRYG